MLAVKQIAGTMCFINKLMVSIMINVGMMEIVLPCVRKCTTGAFILWRKSRIKAPSHSVIAIPKFFEIFEICVCWGECVWLEP